MPKKVVDAYDEDGLVFASYTIILNLMNLPINDEDYVQEAKQCHEEDGLSPSLVEKWIVRDPQPDEV